VGPRAGLPARFDDRPLHGGGFLVHEQHVFAVHASGARRDRLARSDLHRPAVRRPRVVDPAAHPDRERCHFSLREPRREPRPQLVDVLPDVELELVLVEREREDLRVLPAREEPEDQDRDAERLAGAGGERIDRAVPDVRAVVGIERPTERVLGNAELVVRPAHRVVLILDMRAPLAGRFAKGVDALHLLALRGLARPPFDFEREGVFLVGLKGRHPASPIFARRFCSSRSESLEISDATAT
jgi:hypothetical protein